MGDFNVKAIQSDQHRIDFYKAIMKDLEAFDLMLKNGMVEPRSDMIGAEQEICIVNKEGQPLPAALDILANITDPRYTNELALYNLEVNLSPQKLEGDSFRRMANELSECLDIGRKAAAPVEGELFLTGLLPTLNFRHLMFDYMTPEERYKLLSQELLNLRGSNFEIYMQGVDDFHATLESVLFEACNTSFQVHLQIDPSEFAMMHNWSQMISGPVLAACTNSPLLFGKELWSENRIALFKQSLDTRGKKNHSRVILPRVYFGHQWLEGSAIELWKKDVVRFPLLLRGFGDDDPLESLENGVIPRLKSIRLHNGTTYTWNRLCYGVANNSPHIRIECRYLPAGPTEEDEIANTVFWIGLMKGIPDDKTDFWKKTDFRIAKSNFLKGAREGIQSVMYWFGKNYAVKDLIREELLPIAREGLTRMNIDNQDIDHYLSIIEERVSSEQTGSQWQKHNFQRLRKHFKPSLALRVLVQQSLANQKEGIPVHKWQNTNDRKYGPLPSYIYISQEWVEDIMNKEVISVRDNVSVEVIRQILDWQGFNHLLVENKENELVGIISTSLLNSNQFDPNHLARDIMIRNVISVGPGDTIAYAKEIMEKHGVSCLPVLENATIVGILTGSDL